jgi:DNA-binding beta-propeller fold protein YncE
MMRVDPGPTARRDITRHRLPAFLTAELLVVIAFAALLVRVSGTPAAPADSSALELIQTVPLKGASGRLDHLALDARGSRLFIANLSNNSLDVIDLKAGALVKQIPGQRKAQGVAYSPELDRIFVGCGTDGVCNALDGRTYKLLHSLKLPDADNVHYDPRTRRVYVGHEDRALTAFDAESYTVKGTVRLPGPPEAFQLDPNRPRLYVNTHDPAAVAEVDTDRLEVVARHPLTKASGNYPMALDAADGRVFVGCRKGPMVVVLDTASGKEVAAVGLPGDVDDLFYDAKRKRLYATCGEGLVAVVRQVDGDHYELAEKVPTTKLARTGFFDAEGGLLYVVVPRLNGPDGPQLCVYRVKP